MHHSKNTQRGATLTGYALVLSAFAVLSLGSIDGLNSASSSYLEQTSDDIAQPRELGQYDEMEEIPDPGGNGDDTGENEEPEAHFELADGGQVVGTAEGYCINLEADGRLRMRDCDGSTTQVIEVYTDESSGQSQLRIAGMCIGLAHNSNNQADPYVAEECDEDDTSQRFRRMGDQWESVSATNPQMCLDSGGLGEGRALHQWTCSSTNENQKWADPEAYVPPLPEPPTPVVTGQGTFVGAIPDGTSLTPNADFDANSSFVFSESVVLLEDDLNVGGVTIPQGTVVCSYIVWYSPTGNRGSSASIDFGAPVLAGAMSTAELTATDSFAAPGVTYGYDRAWESTDQFNVNGNTLGIAPWASRNNADMLRVFTQCG